ncbi:MAG: 3-dehydroquinate dehydratase-2 [Chloroflexi bacterium]|jgi:3-dehydroquinate dehydratase-2|nr:MAG: 3-dehydroquinate dehydratase-2 [Chloroflexota bacterium]
MKTYLVINGPNLNNLGKRDSSVYGSITLPEIQDKISALATKLGVKVEFFQSNFEGALIDYIQERAITATGIIINPGALTHYSYSLMDALADQDVPIVEVHISDIYSREEFRRHSVIKDIASKQITGHGWKGYMEALEYLVTDLATDNRNRPD